MSNNKQIEKSMVVTFRHFAHKGYSAYASLGREIRIGVLSVATLGAATLASADVVADNTDRVPEDDNETALETVVVTGTMAPLTQLQSARIVSVLSRQDIEQAGVQSVNDLFKLATGVDVRQRGGFGVQTDISIDGGLFDQMTILLNGVNISNPHTGHLAADFPVSISDIERIEILEGAASRVYGGNAFGGAINVVTKKDNQNSLSVGAEGGSFGTMQADGSLSLKSGQMRNRLSGGGGRSDGGTTNSDWRKGQFYYQGDWWSPSIDMNWQFGLSKKQYGANTFYSAAYPNQYERNERYLMSVGAETKGKFHLMPQLYWNRTYDNFELIRDSRTGENFHMADVYGAKLNGYFNWYMGRTALGAEIRQEGILSSSLGRDLDEEMYVEVRHEDGIYYTRKDSRTNVSYNLEHNILLDNWTISAGVLANMNTSVDHRFRFYPGVDIAYRPDQHWKLYVSYNKGFRLPTFTDLYYKSPTHNGNQGLKPEENRSIQLGANFHTRGITATVRGFYHRGHKMIDWVMYDASDTYHSANFDLDNMGVQLTGKLNLNEMCGHDVWVKSLDLGYTYIHQDRHDDTPIFKSNYAMEYLRHKLVANLNHRIWSKLDATWSLRWQDRMGGYILYENNVNTGVLQSYHPYTTLDVKLQWTDPRYQVYVQGTNVTNHKYYDLGNVQQPGAWMMAGVRWNLKF